MLSAEMLFVLVWMDMKVNIVIMLSLQLRKLLFQKPPLLLFQKLQLLKHLLQQPQKIQLSLQHLLFQNQPCHQPFNHHNVHLTQHHLPKTNKSVLLTLQQLATWSETTSETKVTVWLWFIKEFTNVFWNQYWKSRIKIRKNVIHEFYRDFMGPSQYTLKLLSPSLFIHLIY